VGITLLCSWFVSVTFVPLLASRLLHKVHQDRKLPASGFYRLLLTKVIKRPGRSLVFILLLVLGLQSLMKYVTTEMFPPSSRPEVLVYIDLPAGYNVDQTNKAVHQISDWLLDDAKNPDVKDVIAYIGTGGPRFSLAVVPNWPAPHRAFMIVKAADTAHAKSLLQDIRRFAAEHVSQASVRTEPITRGVVPPGVVELRFSGPDADELYQIARRAEAALAAIPDTLHVRNDWENRTRRLRIVIDQARTYRAGVSFQAVADALNAEFSGRKISQLRQSDILVPIYIRSPEKGPGASGSLDLWSLKIPVGDGSGGGYVTLDQVATIEEVVQFGNILRRDLAKTITVSGKHLHWDSAELQRNWDESIEDIYRNLPPGYAIELGGELENYSQSTGPMVLSVPLFIGLILCVVIAQFNSIRRTLMVFLTIPMAISGGVLGLFIFNANLDFIGMLGFLSLAGIVVNHAIVLIDKADKLVLSGLTVEHAAMEAGMNRLRPIVITSATTVLGLVPLLLIEDSLFQAMTIVIMSGLTVGTLFTVVAVPAMYRFLLRDEPARAIEITSV
jgi:multidrug efflux pump